MARSGVRQSMAITARDYGKSRLSQAVEIFRLALGGGHITAGEYYNYRLFDDSSFSFSDKQRFIGNAGQEQLKKLLIDERWKILADDKFLFATLFQTQGFPLARIVATYNYGPNKRARSIPSFHTPEALKQFLKDEVDYPVFAKPVAGSYGLGCFAMDSIDRAMERISLANEGTLTIGEFIDKLGRFGDGYMFQERMHPHRVIRDICGDRIATARVVVLLDSCGPQISHACFRIPAGGAISDNFAHGRAGNLLAAVAIEDGRLGRAVKGVGLAQESFGCHPDTGKEIEGVSLPYWREVKDLCAEAALMLPGFHLQSWDIAICDDGPLLQEVQGGDFDVQQFASQRGMLDDRFRMFLGSINRHWRREVVLSLIDGIPRRIYRALNPKRNEATT